MSDAGVVRDTVPIARRRVYEVDSLVNHGPDRSYRITPVNLAIILAADRPGAHRQCRDGYIGVLKMLVPHNCLLLFLICEF